MPRRIQTPSLKNQYSHVFCEHKSSSNYNECKLNIDNFPKYCKQDHLWESCFSNRAALPVRRFITQIKILYFFKKQITSTTGFVHDFRRRDRSAFGQYFNYFTSETCVPHEFSWGTRIFGLEFTVLSLKFMGFLWSTIEHIYARIQAYTCTTVDNIYFIHIK